jgi:hypothetical protein
MKTRTYHLAARRGSAAEWTCDDVEAARRQANETARPWGHQGLTPQEAWRSRSPILVQERTDLDALLLELEAEARKDQGYPPQIPLSRTEQAAVNRVAIQRALVKQGLLEFSSTKIPEPY